jgi:hypothetical protein
VNDATAPFRDPDSNPNHGMRWVRATTDTGPTGPTGRGTAAAPTGATGMMIALGLVYAPKAIEG